MVTGNRAGALGLPGARPAHQGPARTRAGRVNRATRVVAADFDVPCLDVADHPGIAEPENFVADGLHPSARGHRQAAAGFAQLLGLDPKPAH